MNSDFPVERIEALHLGPGDVLVVRLLSSFRPSTEDLDAYRAELQRHIGEVPIIFAAGEVAFTPVKATSCLTNES